MRFMNLQIRSPGRVTPLSHFIGSRVEETEARVNRKYRNSLRSL